MCSDEDVDISEGNVMNESIYALVYADLVVEIGVENTKKIHKRFKGTQVSFPVKLYNRNYIEKCIKEEFNGSNFRELAQKYEYTERRIRQILKNHE